MSRLQGGLVVIIAAIAAAAPTCQPEPPPVKNAEPDLTGFVARSHSSPLGSMPYRVFIPQGYDRQQLYPLVIWLHGAGGTGDDNLRQISGDQIPGTHTWTTPEQQAKHPAFVLVPQSPTAWDTEADTLDLRPPLRLVTEILDALVLEFTIDRRRIYVLGQSMGGHGVWNLIRHAPDRFAAAVLLCPVPGHLSQAASVARMPIWLFQGDADWMVAESRLLIDTLRRAGGRPRYTEYRGAGHDIWTRVFKEPELAGWLFAQSR